MKNLKINVIDLVCLVLLNISCNKTSDLQQPANDFNKGWRFRLGDAPDAQQTNFTMLTGEI